MNTNLHVLEAYTNLARACSLAHNGSFQQVRKALEDVLRITLAKIVNRNWRFELFFDMNWHSLSKDISFGHDIEGSWLLYEAALAAGNENLIGEVKQTSMEIANVTLAAVDHDKGGLLSARDEAGQIARKKEWWPQAEAVVGFYNAHELTGEQKYFDAADSIWEYIKDHFVDSVHGEWHNELNGDNAPDPSMPKAGFWKCPYHNARACFEIIRRNS
jgi:mannobiose 2-epimerase